MIYLHSSQSAEFFCNDIGNETDVFRAIKLLYFHPFLSLPDNPDEMNKFELTSAYRPTGDQPEAIAQLTEGVLEGVPAQTCWA